ncbi:MAG: hypothetical protein HWE14_14445 [Flavobacteriia bacterium]|nr:hypothetical protein [Flavobacteriia bacterium]
MNKTNDQETVVLPVPASYVVDENGAISLRYFDINSRIRVGPTVIYKNL